MTVQTRFMRAGNFVLKMTPRTREKDFIIIVVIETWSLHLRAFKTFLNFFFIVVKIALHGLRPLLARLRNMLILDVRMRLDEIIDMLNVAAFLVGGDFFDVGEDDDGFDSKKIFFAEETEITMFTCFKIYKIKKYKFTMSTEILGWRDNLQNRNDENFDIVPQSELQEFCKRQ